MNAWLFYEVTPWTLDRRRKVLLLTALVFAALC